MADMEYVVEYSQDGKYIFASATGVWDPAIDNAMVGQILEMVDSTGVLKVLLDIHELQFNLPIVRIFERAKEMREARRQFGKTSLKAAIVYSADNAKLEEDMIFFETASRNRGLPYRAFKNMDAAIAWLIDS